MDEKRELDEKLSKLGVFIESGDVDKINPRQGELLRSQYWTMQTYTDILERRLELLEE